MYVKRNVLRVTETERTDVTDEIAVERKLRILVNGKEALSLYCSPSMIRELVTGLIATEGMIHGEWCAERMSVEYGEEIIVDVPASGEITVGGAIRTSGCIGGITYEHREELQSAEYEGTIGRGDLLEMFRTFQGISEPYRATGCIHSAALAGWTGILVHAEDIGRHNAVDKVIGYCLLEGLSMEDKIMLVSGRLSSEIAYKCARWQIPIVASRTAPTVRAVEIAERSGVTMVGFLREKRFNVYCNPRRIL
ncbi:MAG: formate dehydrogenase accessory sulfurtransferase FdhD [Thermodesulfovibrionales bacterium]